MLVAQLLQTLSSVQLIGCVLLQDFNDFGSHFMSWSPNSLTTLNLYKWALVPLLDSQPDAKASCTVFVVC